MSKQVFGLIVATSLISLFSFKTHAVDLDWSGVYRVEGNYFAQPELTKKGHEQDYGLHHLILRPKITAGDGLTIYGQFDLFNSTGYPNSQLGQYFGHGVRTVDRDNTTSSDDSNSLSSTESAESLAISQLYLTLTQEYGSLIVGRVPLQFGLGMTYNAGMGLFDHWYDTRDLVGYKVVMGNLFILPMYAKDQEGIISHTDDINEYMIQAEYDNPETDLSMGVFYQVRRASDQASDAPVSTTDDSEIGGTGATQNARMNMRTINIFALKDRPSYRLGVEASFQDGDAGIKTASGDNVSFGGFGVAGEFEYRPTTSLWKFGAKAGYATGDDPATKDKFEGYVFNRNYDVAFLLFNHPVGQADFFRTKAFGGGGSADIQSPDTESISNVMYLSPYTTYKWGDRWQLRGALTTGWLSTSPFAGESINKSVGYELDLSVNFIPRKGVQWINEFGALFPGSAFKGTSADSFDTRTLLGFSTKAAISF